MNKYKEILKDTILFIVLLPINIIMILLGSLRGAVFYLLDINYIKDDINCLEFWNGKNGKSIEKLLEDVRKLKEQTSHIETNLMYDNTPDEINKSISFIKEQIDGLIKTVHTNKYDIKELKNGAQVLIDCVNAGKAVESDISFIRKDINELQLSLESMKPKDLGTFNFISDEPTQVELNIIEAEAKGESVVKEEYDYTIEDRARNKQIQDRMKEDEYAFICTEDDINC